MDFEIKIWDLPKTEKEAITFFQDKGLFPTANNVSMDTARLYTLTTRNIFGSVTIGHV